MEFGKRYSIQDIKDLHNVDSINIVKNPKNDKLFVTAGAKTISAVSTKFEADKPAEFVELIDGETTLLCLCPIHTDNIVTTL